MGKEVMKVDPSFRNPVPLGAALFTVLHLKKQQKKKEADPSDPPGFDPDTLFFLFTEESSFSGY